MSVTEIGEMVRQRRQVLGIDQQALAELGDVSVHTLSNIESGKGNPSLKVLVRVLDAVGMELKLSVKGVL